MKINLDSPIVQKLELLTNLFFLNILWLLCSLPLFTVGAATAALYDAMFRCIRNRDDSVLRPFFQAFCRNFLQATAVWIPLAVYILFIIFDWTYLVAAEIRGFSALLYWLPFAVSVVLVAAVLVFYFPMTARYRMKILQMLKSSLAFAVMYPLQTILIFALQILPLVLFLTVPYWFLKLGMVWAFIWFSLTAYLSAKLLLRIFMNHSEEEARLGQSE